MRHDCQFAAFDCWAIGRQGGGNHRLVLLIPETSAIEEGCVRVLRAVGFAVAGTASIARRVAYLEMAKG